MKKKLTEEQKKEHELLKLHRKLDRMSAIGVFMKILKGQIDDSYFQLVIDKGLLRDMSLQRIFNAAVKYHSTKYTKYALDKMKLTNPDIYAFYCHQMELKEKKLERVDGDIAYMKSLNPHQLEKLPPSDSDGDDDYIPPQEAHLEAKLEKLSKKTLYKKMMTGQISSQWLDFVIESMKSISGTQCFNMAIRYRHEGFVEFGLALMEDDVEETAFIIFMDKKINLEDTAHELNHQIHFMTTFLKTYFKPNPKSIKEKAEAA